MRHNIKTHNKYMFKITNSIKKKKIKDSLTFPLQPKEYVVDLFFFA